MLLGLVLASGVLAAAVPAYSFGPILTLADPAPSHPEIDARYSPPYRRCMARSDLNTILHDQCNGQEMKRQDVRLNAAWAVTFKRVGPARQAALRSAERAWINDRQKHCLLQSKEAEGGTLEAIEYSSCMIDETIRRTIWLEKLR
ncbi:uncharacterized protein YecT (DUF1311 family) [Novosphingobium sp. SG751A]|uniref:lysozyme inhibitor LprI family protein n=1 Tax=Novosphingobium sp. SG751A TaxID=2587000 RepID=UPI00155478CF|nr:lysozyme inhibitor LprI family protein [Novosphingobium sp. SG751A]NOW44296.1 uncharacterized protein YecT (DUF1311 family) [Novosphingobium sp. SG751A]